LVVVSVLHFRQVDGDQRPIEQRRADRGEDERQARQDQDERMMLDTSLDCAAGWAFQDA